MAGLLEEGPSLKGLEGAIPIAAVPAMLGSCTAAPSSRDGTEDKKTHCLVGGPAPKDSGAARKESGAAPKASGAGPR
eukprot:CAMPEP_0183572154 /NCGR_PEP_ID=MMETSP0371-20130417/127890_1 /TAXON_ID=268820 /ORGANISM="Peridinium aciculiferum, Strain PAER-2" /LENGTH=76 /DNA_ID=CAMNT_0025781983 /DNA_START=144 /DNA_END=370 /DNA_ORIENTATION=+